MANEQQDYSWWNFFKKIGSFISFVIDFFRNRNKNQQIKSEEEKQKIQNDLKNGYDAIDKNKDDKKNEDLEKRLKNLF